MTLSVAFLVKEPPMDRFSALVEYLRVIASEIVIVDTGSSEADKEAMLSWGDRFEGGVTIIESEWKNNFAEARNIGLKECTSDWTLVVDPDEIPSVDMVLHIKGVLEHGWKKPQALGWAYWTNNYWAGVKGPEEEYHWHCRLFKTGKGEFYRPIHELVRLDGKDESATRRGIMPFAPPEAYLIHSKGREAITKDDAMYGKLGEVSK